MRRYSAPRGSPQSGSGSSTSRCSTTINVRSHERLRADTATAENRIRSLRQRLRLLLGRQGQRRAAQPVHRLHTAAPSETPHRGIPHGLRDTVPRHGRLCQPDAGRERRHTRRLPGLRAVQGADLYFDVPAVLEAVGRVQAGTVGARDACGLPHAPRLPVLQGRHVGLRIPELLCRVAPRPQPGGTHVLPDR